MKLDELDEDEPLVPPLEPEVPPLEPDVPPEELEDVLSSLQPATSVKISAAPVTKRTLRIVEGYGVRTPIHKDELDDSERQTALERVTPLQGCWQWLISIHLQRLEVGSRLHAVFAFSSGQTKH